MAPLESDLLAAVFSNAKAPYFGVMCPEIHQSQEHWQKRERKCKPRVSRHQGRNQLELQGAVTTASCLAA
jgi:hypothetical protein